MKLDCSAWTPKSGGASGVTDRVNGDIAHGFFLLVILGSSINKIVKRGCKMKIRRFFSLGVIVLATMLVLTLGSGVASAADFCRTDPILILDNGKTLSVDVGIDTSIANVKSIEIKVFLPRGVKVNDIQYSGDPQLKAKEQVKVLANGKPGEYKSEVRVMTTKTRTTVETITELRLTSDNSLLGSKHVDGRSNQALKATIISR